jgi:hypothetical protein
VVDCSEAESEGGPWRCNEEKKIFIEEERAWLWHAWLALRGFVKAVEGRRWEVEVGG